MSVSARSALYYPLVVISDQHFPKTAAQAEALLEFLLHVRCETLVINGDFIDGWFLKRKNHRKFPEMQMRVMDRVNYMASNETRVIYLPGNHDEKLRGHWNKRKRKITAPDADCPSILDQTYIFHDKKSGHKSSIELKDSIIYIDRLDRKVLILHGDQFHPAALKTKWGQRISDHSDDGYDLLIHLDRKLLDALKEESADGFSFARFAKHHAKKAVRIIDAFEKGAQAIVKRGEADAIICGDLHELRLNEKDPLMICGDWIETCGAIVHTKEGTWEKLLWKKKRKALGLERLPCENDPNPHADFRGVTERQLRIVQAIWRGQDYEDRSRAIKKTRNAMLKLKAEFEKDVKKKEASKKYRKAAHRLEKLRHELLPY